MLVLIRLLTKKNRLSSLAQLPLKPYRFMQKRNKNKDELATQEAADLLNVSRPYLIQLLKEGKIPHRKVGTKRRILAKDVIRYKKAIYKKRYKALEELTKQAQELGMGYEMHKP